MTDRGLAQAEERARRLLDETELFDELGLGKFAAGSRCVARDVLELVADLAAERSVRVAMQAARDRLQEMLAARGQLAAKTEPAPPAVRAAA